MLRMRALLKSPLCHMAIEPSASTSRVPRRAGASVMPSARLTSPDAAAKRTVGGR
jgi:hypothetical protein